MTNGRREGALSMAGIAWLGIRMAGWSMVLPLLKRLLPLSKLARVMWSSPKGNGGPARQAQIIRLADLLYRLRPGDNCLERSLVAYRFLGRANADPRLVLGVQRHGAGVAGHVWVLVDGTPIHDTHESVTDFVPVLEITRPDIP